MQPAIDETNVTRYLTSRAEKAATIAASRNIVREIADYMICHEGCTREEMLLRFTAHELDTHADAGRDLANRRAKIRQAH